MNLTACIFSISPAQDRYRSFLPFSKLPLSRKNSAATTNAADDNVDDLEDEEEDDEDADKVSTASVMERRIEEVNSELMRLEQEVKEDYIVYLR